MASLRDVLLAHQRAGLRVSTGHGESPESRERRGQSLAIAQLKDAQIAADEALRSGNYKAYLKSKSAQNDSLIKYMVDMQKNAGNNRAKVDAAKIGRLADIDKSLDARLSTDVFKGLKSLQVNNGLGDPGKTLKHPLMKEALVKELKSFGDDARGLNETRALLRVVGKQHNPPLSVEQVEEYLENREVPESWVNGRLARAKDAESRIHSDLNSLRVERADILREVRRGYAGGGWVRRNFGGAGDPAAAMMQNPQGLQSAYEAEVPAGSRSKEFEIAERERQLGGTLGQTLLDILDNEEFKDYADKLGLQTSSERRQFANAMIKGERAANRFMDRYLGEGRNYGEGAARPGGPRGDGIAKVGRWQGSGYAEGDDVLFGSVKEREAADKEQLDKIKAAEEETDLGGEESVQKAGQGMKNIVNHFKKKGLGPDKIPPHWLERARGKIAEQRHIRQQEGGDAAEIERLSNMVSYIERLEEHIKGAPERAESEALDEQIAGLAVPKGPIDFQSASAKKVLDDLRAEKEGANALKTQWVDGKETVIPSDGRGVKAPPDEVEEVSAQEEVVEEPAPSAEAVAPRTLASKEQYEAAGLKPPRRYKKLLGQLREGR